MITWRLELPGNMIRDEGTMRIYTIQRDYVGIAPLITVGNVCFYFWSISFVLWSHGTILFKLKFTPQKKPSLSLSLYIYIYIYIYIYKYIYIYYIYIYIYIYIYKYIYIYIYIYSWGQKFTSPFQNLQNVWKDLHKNHYNSFFCVEQSVIWKCHLVNKWQNLKKMNYPLNFCKVLWGHVS